VNKRIIPAVIMWKSPDSPYEYILDGAHRVSVVLAWLNDDWGDKTTQSGDVAWYSETLTAARETARIVRQLVETEIGSAKQYAELEDRMDRLMEENKAPKQVMGERDFRRAMFFASLRKDNVGFRVQYVSGDYRTAEESFLRINSSGRSLSPWERKLIENRDSSMARVIMSIAAKDVARRYWSIEGSDDSEKQRREEQVNKLVAAINKIDEMLLKPQLSQPLRTAHQPMLVAPDTERKPFYVAEFLTVVAGEKGSAANTENLLSATGETDGDQILSRGTEIVTDAVDALTHLAATSNPKSLGLVPTIYFYSENAPMRGLLYGFMYWLLSGSETDIINRKRGFSAYRGVFEEFWLANRSFVLSRWQRGLGSGAEVTEAVARFYDRMSRLLIDCKGDIESTIFKDGYSEIKNDLPKASTVSESSGTQFTTAQKSKKHLQQVFPMLPRCEICNGHLDPTRPGQHDHILPVRNSGMADESNQRLVHSFCNNNRDKIEEIQKGAGFDMPTHAISQSAGMQLSLFAEPELSDQEAKDLLTYESEDS
jgi:hypothetical protein